MILEQFRHRAHRNPAQNAVVLKLKLRLRRRSAIKQLTLRRRRRSQLEKTSIKLAFVELPVRIVPDAVRWNRQRRLLVVKNVRCESERRHVRSP
jgi:hypothetical protein